MCSYRLTEIYLDILRPTWIGYNKANCGTAVYDTYSISWLLNTWHLSTEDIIEVIARFKLLILDQVIRHIQ